MKTRASNVDDWLRRAAEQLAATAENPVLEAQLLLAESLHQPRAWLLAHPEYLLDQSTQINAEARLMRVCAGDPLPYVLGHWEFYALDFLISPAALIPRPETEIIVEAANDWLMAHPLQRWMADVGTGSGCIAAALARQYPDLNVIALEISAPAISLAQLNFEQIGVTQQVQLIQSNLLDGLPHPVDLLCANLPYIPSEDVDRLAVSRSEPRLALDGGADGLRVIERLLSQMAEKQACRSLALLEIEFRQGDAARALAQRYFPLAEVTVLPDLAGKDRVLKIQMAHHL